MYLFTYDNQTKEYIGSERQYIDPLESKKEGRDIYVMTDNTTDVKPLEFKEGFTQIWNGKKWEYKELLKEPIPEPEPTQEEIEEMEYQAFKDVEIDKDMRARFKASKK